MFWGYISPSEVKSTHHDDHVELPDQLDLCGIRLWRRSRVVDFDVCVFSRLPVNRGISWIWAYLDRNITLGHGRLLLDGVHSIVLDVFSRG